jgi:hypothetical protein
VNNASAPTNAAIDPQHSVRTRWLGLVFWGAFLGSKFAIFPKVSPDWISILKHRDTEFTEKSLLETSVSSVSLCFKIVFEFIKLLGTFLVQHKTVRPGIYQGIRMRLLGKMTRVVLSPNALFVRVLSNVVRQLGIRLVRWSQPRTVEGDHPTAHFLLLVCVSLFGMSQAVSAAEPEIEVRDGLKLYAQEEFEAAREKFAGATEELDKQKSAAAAIAAFDEACASHRKGDWEKARDSYLHAGLSLDKSIAVAAHFNLGNLSGEQARKLAGDKPETVPVDKRQEILDHLKQAIASYRHCLELQPDHAPSRRNLELVRLWIKYYSDKWNEHDRQKRRDETNLIQFLEYLMQAQTTLRESVKSLPTPVRSDALAELKRVQAELHEEIPTLREKIEHELRPPAAAQTPGGTSPPAGNAAAGNSKQLDSAIALLQGWADAAGQNMSAAAARLGEKETTAAVNDQQAVLNELDKIWDAVIPFHPLLAKELAEQTSIVKSLAPQVTDGSQQPEPKDQEPQAKDVKQIQSPASEKPEPPIVDKIAVDTAPPPNSAASPTATTATEQPVLGDAQVDLKQTAEVQEKTLRKTRLLAPKAEAELERLEHAPPPPAPPVGPAPKDPDHAPANGQPQQPDPEQMKAGYRKAIELAPKAVEQMESAAKSMQQQNRQTAAQHAEEARKILEEIQKAQPQNDQKQNDKKQDEQKQDQKQQDEQDKKQQQDQKNKDQKNDEKKNEDQQKDEKKNKDEKGDEKKNEDQKQQEQQQKQQQQGQVSPDRIEEALRQVRERQQAKRERDRKLKGRIMGRAPVDKDW